MEEVVGDEIEKSQFMEKLFNINYQTIVYTIENMYNTSGYGPSWDLKDVLPMFQRSIDHKRLEPALEGVDLGDLRHYKYCDLIPYASANQSKEYALSRLHFGRLCSGEVVYCGEVRPVVIKTWDVFYPPNCSTRFGLDYAIQPPRLFNDIQLLTEEPMKSHSHVPKIIGYSIDKILAVVYDLRVKCTLTRFIRGESSLHDRLSMAAKVGYALQTFHNKGIGIGCVESNSILLDQEDNVYFCDFGLSSHVQAMLKEEIEIYDTFGGYGINSPELYSEKSKWTLETDTYGYGILLLEFVVQKPVARSCGGDYVRRWLDIDTPLVSIDISRLVKSCLEENPNKRPKIGSVAEALEKIIAYQDGLEDNG